MLLFFERSSGFTYLELATALAAWYNLKNRQDSSKECCSKMQELVGTIKKEGIKKLCIWCGAGISASSPCELPLGNELSLRLCQKYIAHYDKISQVRKKCNKIIEKYTIPQETIRPEVVLSCITRMSGLSTTKEFYTSFAQLGNVAFNLNHVLLAHIVKSGGTIFTTNFDNCIEKAYETMFKEHMEILEFCNGKIFRYSGKTGGQIIHLHGIFNHGATAGAAIEQVMKGFDIKTHEIMKKALTEDVNLFAGYSFSDDYDLNNVFNNCTEMKYPIFICNHKGMDLNLAVKAASVWNGFFRIVEYDTTELLEEILFMTVSMPMANNNFIKPCDSQKWDTVFKSPICNYFDYKLLYAIEMINQLQISYKVIDKKLKKLLIQLTPKLRIEIAEYYDILLYNLLVNSAYTAHFNTKRLTNHILKQSLKNRFENNYFKLVTRVKKLKRDDQLKIIYDSLKNGKPLTNDAHEVLSAYFRIYTLHLMMGKQPDNDTVLREIIQYICSLDYSREEETYMFASRLRYLYLLTADNHVWTNSLKIYYDIGNLGGVISLLIAKAIVKSRKSNAPIWAQEAWHDAMLLAKWTGNNKYKMKMYYLMGLDTINHFPVLCRLIRRIYEKF